MYCGRLTRVHTQAIGKLEEPKSCWLLASAAARGTNGAYQRAWETSGTCRIAPNANCAVDKNPHTP